jgi:hypothetical protein
VAYAIFDTPAIHGVLGIKELAQAGSEMVPPLVIATAQLLQMLDDSSVHTAGHITVSSNPIIAGAGTSAGTTTRDWASRAIAAHTVDHDTPNARAIDAGVAWMAVIRSLAHATARVVNTRRGSASGACSVQVRVGQSRSGQANTRLHHKHSTKRCDDSLRPHPLRDARDFGLLKQGTPARMLLAARSTSVEPSRSTGSGAGGEIRRR